MKFNISEISIKNPVPILMFFIIATIVGLKSFFSMTVQNFPDITLPAVSVSVGLPNASASQIESEISKKIESSLSGVNGIDSISTTINKSVSTTLITFDLEVPLSTALEDVEQSIKKVQNDFPANTTEAIVSKINFSSTPVLIYTASSSSMNKQELSFFVDNYISKQILNAKGVNSVKRIGGTDREIQILLSPEKLLFFNISAQEVSSALKSAQINASAGYVQLSNGASNLIEAQMESQYIKDLENIILNIGEKQIYLKDIGTIIDTNAQISSVAKIDSKEVVAFEITRTKGFGEIEVEKNVKEKIEKILAENSNIELKEAFNFVSPVKNDYKASMNLLFEGALLAVIVVWLFLRDIRATIVSAIALPLSIIPTFIFMNMFDFSLNVITLLALSLVVGILVDDAIVEVENIERHISMGKTPFQAAIEATQEIGMAVIATTFTLIAVFLPTAFMSGVPGLVFKQFGWTAAIAVFFSLVVARLLTPLAAAVLMNAKPHIEHKDPKWMTIYLKIIDKTLKHKFLTVLGAFVFFILSLSLIPLLPTGFIPANNSDQTQIVIETDKGSSVEETLEIADIATKKIENLQEISSIYTSIGAGSSGQGGGAKINNSANKAILTINLKPASEREKKQEIEKKIRQLLVDLPSARFTVGQGASGEKYTFTIISDNKDNLYETAKAIIEQASQIKNVGTISSDYEPGAWQYSLKIKNDIASYYGLNTSSIARVVQNATIGDYETAVSKLNAQDRQISIYVKLKQNIYDKEGLENLLIKTNKGFVPLSAIASVEKENTPNSISRYNKSNSVTIDIELASANLNEVIDSVKQLEAVKNMPSDIEILQTGDSQRMQELFSSFGLAIITGIVLIYIILVLLFKDFLQPITILIALPLSFGGAFLGLLLFNTSFSMPSLIGIIMLMGIATKNSILLVDYAIEEIKKGTEKIAAMKEACHKRARPIIMTTLAMGFGMLPVALGLGNVDNSFRAPMAIAVIGGLITSTFLSLIVIPAFFIYMDNFKNMLKKLKK